MRDRSPWVTGVEPILCVASGQTMVAPLAYERVRWSAAARSARYLRRGSNDWALPTEGVWRLAASIRVESNNFSVTNVDVLRNGSVVYPWNETLPSAISGGDFWVFSLEYVFRSTPFDVWAMQWRQDVAGTIIQQTGSCMSLTFLGPSNSVPPGTFGP